MSVGTRLPRPARGDRGRRESSATVVVAAVGVPILLAASLLAGRIPLVVAGGVAAVVVVGVCLARPRVALLVLVAAGALESSLPVSTTGTVTPVKVAGALCFGCFALDAVVRRRVLRFDWTHGLLALLLALAMVSTLGARSTGDALTTTVRYASFAGLYFVATQAADRKLAVQITWVASAAAALAASLAIRRFVVGDAPLARPLNGDPNDLAFILVTTIPLTFWLLRTKGPARAFVVAMLVASVAGAVLSLSRGALLGLAVGGVWHAVTHRRHVPVLLLGVAVTGAAALLAAGSIGPQVESGLRLKGAVAQENVETRLDAWRAAAELAAEHPIDGVGPGNFGLYYHEATGRPPGTDGLRVVHDAYLDVAAELGVTGLVLFVAFLAATLHRASVAVRRAGEPPGLAAAVRTAMVVAAVAAITLSEQYYPPFWVLGALGTVLWLGSPAAAPPAGPRRTPAVAAVPDGPTGQ